MGKTKKDEPKKPSPDRGRLAFLTDVKNRLVKDYNAITSRIGSLISKGKGLFEEHGIKDEENAAEVAEYQNRLSLEKNLEKAKGEIEEALKKVEAGTYGICQECGNQIESERLKILPSATICAACIKKARQK
ncbi:MAG: TraR/DksA C4-type zinc finger protein [Patescibacteria group bacterium]|jgi:RNA polymerase-binding transcription factor DksA